MIAGVTTRPFAASAARAGYRVTAADAFGDLDLRAIAKVLLVRPQAGQSYSPLQAAEAAASTRADLAAYTSNFENHPAAVTRLSQGCRLLGNSAATLVRVRDPIELQRVLRRAGLPALESRIRAPEPAAHQRSWLLKPVSSGGGHGIRRWSSEESVPKGMYLQQYVRGIPGSLSFAADGSRAVVLGWSRQLVGEADFGVGPFRYCGSMVGATAMFPQQNELLRYAAELAAVLTREFRLVGLNGLDFIARRGVPYPTEVNPRYSSSMELIERATGLSMFEAHLAACKGNLPATPVERGMVYAKAVVFARRRVEVRKLPGRSGTRWIADVPHAGDIILQGRPICTVFATARTVERCRTLLQRRAAAVYRSLRAEVGQAA